MRGPKYVATVASIYRHALDEIANGTFTPSEDDEIALRLAYSRNFTMGYGANAPPASIMQPVHINHPGNSGVYIGTIKNIDSRHIAYIEPVGYTNLMHGDGLSIFSDHGRCGTTLTTLPKIQNGLLEIPVPKEARSGDSISLTHRPEITSTYESLIAEHQTKPRQVNHIEALITINASGSIDVTATLVTPHHTLSFSYQSEYTLPRAQKYELKGEDLEKQIQKTKNTPFVIASTIICPPGLFAPIKMQNEIRREIITHATEKLHHAYERSPPHLSEREIKINSHCSREKPQIIVLQSEYTREETETPHMRYISWHAFRAHHDPDHDTESVGLLLPIMTSDSDLALMEKDLALFTSWGITKYLVHTLGQAEWIRSQAPYVQISGYLGLNVTNHKSISMLEEYSFLTLAAELSAKQIQKISRYSTVPLAVVVQGTMVIGVTKNLQSIPWNTAPAFALLDEKNRLFHVLPDGVYNTIICNTDELTLIDHVPELVRWGIQYLIIDARGRSSAYTKNMISLYTEVLHGADPALLKSSLQQMVAGRCTSAAWNRGL